MPPSITDAWWTTEDEAVVLKVMSDPEEKFYTSTRVGLHYRLSFDQLPIECFLTCEDTQDVARNGKSFHVIAPRDFGRDRDYDKITVLDKNHTMMFRDDNNPGCGGRFMKSWGVKSWAMNEKKAVREGQRFWYKMTPALVEHCRRIHAELAAISTDAFDRAGMKRSLEMWEADTADLEEQAKRLDATMSTLKESIRVKKLQASHLRLELGINNA